MMSFPFTCELIVDGKTLTSESGGEIEIIKR
jgi:hypothetical protein